MRDIRGDLQDRANFLEEQISAARIQFEKRMERFAREHEAKISDLQAELEAVTMLMEREYRRIMSAPEVEDERSRRLRGLHRKNSVRPPRRRPTTKRKLPTRNPRPVRCASPIVNPPRWSGPVRRRPPRKNHPYAARQNRTMLRGLPHARTKTIGVPPQRKPGHIARFRWSNRRPRAVQPPRRSMAARPPRRPSRVRSPSAVLKRNAVRGRPRHNSRLWPTF